MKHKFRSKILLVLAIVFSSCAPKHGPKSIELIAYNYFLDEHAIKCYRYSIIDFDGKVENFWWKVHDNRTHYFKTSVDSQFIDSLLQATEKQKEDNSKVGTQSHEGTELRVKISFNDSKYEVIDFGIGTPIYKYFNEIFNNKKYQPTNDTLDFVKKRFALINIVWKKDSSFYNYNFPRPKIITR